MAGTGKRAGQRKTWVLKYLHPYFGKQGFTSRKTEKDKRNAINLRDVEKNIDSYIKQGFAKKTKEGIEIEFRDYKILGEGDVKEKLIIKAKSFSKSAKENIEKSGGKAVLQDKTKT
ncbi:uL15 family ribosomal protein [archaeon]|nr:uL15 family ribosomal protein [archaeon]